MVQQLQADIALLEGLVVITEDGTARAELQEKIDALKKQIALITGSVKFEVKDQAELKIKKFREELEKLPKDPNYKAVGSFEIESQQLTDLQDYTKAMMEAASATGDFSSAVERMQSAIEQQLQADIEAVEMQAWEQIQLIASLEGLSEEEGLAQAEAVKEAMDAKIAELKAAAEAAKEGAKVLDNGTASDDMPYVYAQAKESVAASGSTLSHETGHSMLEAIDKATSEARADMRVEGEGAVQTLMEEVKAQYEGLAAAEQTYSTALAEAEAQRQTTLETSRQQITSYDAMQQAMDRYVDMVDAGKNTQDAYNVVLEDFGEQISALPGGLDSFTQMLSDADGSLSEDTERISIDADALTGDIEAATEAYESAGENYTQAVQEAKDQLKDTLGELKDSTLSSDAMEGAIIEIDETGVDISGAETALLTGVPAALEAAYAAAETAAQTGTDPGKAIAAAVETSAGLVEDATVDAVDAAVSAGQAEGQQGASVGAAMGDSVARGLQGKISEVAAQARSMVQQAMQAAREEAQGAGATGPTDNGVTGNGIGATIARNIAAGFETETPNAVRIIRQSTANLMSGAAGVSERRFGGAVTSNGGTFRFDYEEMGARVAAAVSNLSFGFSVGGRQLAMATAEDNGQQMAIQNRRTTSRYGG